jgi:hypothetical protein
MDERYETLIANLAAIAAGQQILIDRLLRELPEVEGDADLLRIANDARVLLAATRLFLRAGPPADEPIDDREGEDASAE